MIYLSIYLRRGRTSVLLFFLFFKIWCLTYIIYGAILISETRDTHRKGKKMTLEQRYNKAIKEIGGAIAILNLPEQVKEVLMTNASLEIKVKMLEMVADAVR